MVVLGIILARAGSKGLPRKSTRALLGRPVISYTFDHAQASHRLTDFVVSTDCREIKRIAAAEGVAIVDRPPELASDTAPVDPAARHAVKLWNGQHSGDAQVVVLLYGNVPVRSPGLIDRAVDHLLATGADSVRSVAPIDKHHPDWLHRLDGDRMKQFRPNSIYRRQDLEPLYYHDGAVAVVTAEALFGALKTPDDHQAFLGRDRRAVIQSAEDSVDIDGPLDLLIAEAVLRAQQQDVAGGSEVRHAGRT